MVLAPATEELNGMLQQQTPALISVNVIAEQMAVNPEALIDYCRTQGIFIAPTYNGGEYMVNFNALTEEFVRDFTNSLVARTLEPQVQERLQAISSLRQGSVTTLRTAPTEATAPTEKPQALTAAAKPWKAGKKGATIKETDVNLIAHNDPSGEKGFLESLRNQDERAVALVEKTVKTHYKSSTRSKNSLLKEVQNYLGEVEGNATAPTTETLPETKTTEKRPRKTKAETTTLRQAQ